MVKMKTAMDFRLVTICEDILPIDIERACVHPHVVSPYTNSLIISNSHQKCFLIGGEDT